MLSADELHAAVLAALGAAEETLAAATEGPWRVGDRAGLVVGGGRGVAEGMSWDDAHLVAALRNTAAAAYAAARGILERHHPLSAGFCDACAGNVWDRDAGFPCADYRAAAAVIPNLPPEVTDALAR